MEYTERYKNYDRFITKTIVELCSLKENNFIIKIDPKNKRDLCFLEIINRVRHFKKVTIYVKMNIIKYIYYKYIKRLRALKNCKYTLKKDNINIYSYAKYLENFNLCIEDLEKIYISYYE